MNDVQSIPLNIINQPMGVCRRPGAYVRLRHGRDGGVHATHSRACTQTQRQDGRTQTQRPARLGPTRLQDSGMADQSQPTAPLSLHSIICVVKFSNLGHGTVGMQKCFIQN